MTRRKAPPFRPDETTAGAIGAAQDLCHELMDAQKRGRLEASADQLTLLSHAMITLARDAAQAALALTAGMNQARRAEIITAQLKNEPKEPLDS